MSVSIEARIMTPMFSSILKVLTINRKFFFAGSKEDFAGTIRESSDVNIKWLGANNYKLYPNFSVGTLMFSGGGGFGIHVLATLTPHEDGGTWVNIRTKVRPEVYFMVIIFFFVLFIEYSAGTSPLDFLYTFGVLAVCFGWFHFICRAQQNAVIGAAKKLLRMRELTNE